MNIMIAGGGTGGHLFPGIAIAQEFQKRSPDNNIIFLGHKNGIESRILPKLKFPLKTIPVRGFKGKSIFKKICSVFSIPVSLLKAAYYLKRFHTETVIGLGGYISFPAVVAGSALGIRTVIHEQNSIPGLSNRILGRLADRVFISYEESRIFFQKHKTLLSGMPVRNQLKKKPSPGKEKPFCIFILGGSQGAREINHAVMAALPFLAGFEDRIRFIHQTGQSEINMLKENYNKSGFSAQVSAFIDDMFSCYNQAHIVISRAGASTLAELALCSKASVLIPYPFAAADHQAKNAEAFVDRGAALMINSRDLNGKTLATAIKDLEKDRDKLQKMETRAKTLSMPEASKTIVDECCRMAAQRA